MDTSKWKWFRYDEVFDIRKGFYNKKPDDVEDGDIPFIGATDSYNGITSYCDIDTIERTTKTGDGENAPLEEKLFIGNCITVSNNGSVGYAFYQKKKFTCTHDVNPLYLKEHDLNPYIALFLCTLIEKERFRWAYGRKWRPIRMPDSLINLPSTSGNIPDWSWIEQYVKEQIIPALPTKVRKVWLRQYEILPLQPSPLQLTDRNWCGFYVYGFCNEPYKATAYNAIELTRCEKEDDNSIAYITRTNVNNGCSGYVINEGFDDVEKGNAITIGDPTATVYYQENDFICGDHMVVLRSRYFNKYVGLFVATLLNEERFRYNYGRAFNKGVIANTIIQLPVTLVGDPDWQFMEDYIKSLPYSKNI